MSACRAAWPSSASARRTSTTWSRGRSSSSACSPPHPWRSRPRTWPPCSRSPSSTGDPASGRRRARNEWPPRRSLGWGHEPPPPSTRDPGGAGGTDPHRRPRRRPVSIPAEAGLATVRSAILDADHLVRALASGRRKGHPVPVVEGREVRRVEVRVVDLRAGRHLQVTSYDATQAHTTNQLRVTKKGVPLLHTSTRTDEVAPSRGHDRPKDRLLAEDHPVLVALGISDAQGRVKPTRQAKYRQAEEFVRLLDASLSEAV